MALEDIPPREIMEVGKSELRCRTNQFMPTPADILKRWKGEEDTTDDDGKRSTVTRANTDAYRDFKPNPEKALAVQSTIPPDVWTKLGETLRNPPVNPEAERPRETPRDGDVYALAAAMRVWLDMAVYKVKRETWTEFGWWLLRRWPVADWTPELGKEQWRIWQEEQQETGP